MVHKKKSPQIYWSQTETDINIKVDLLLDDMQPDIKMKKTFLSLDAYGFGLADKDSPQKYYFEIDLFESIDVEESLNVSKVDSQLQFVLKKENSRIWWSRLTAQPNKQSWINIDEKLWIPRKTDLVDEPECRDIRKDYPGIEDRLYEAEYGRPKVNRRTIYLMMYNAYQFVCFLYIFVMLLVMYNRDGYYETIKNTYPVLGVTMKSCQLLQYLEVLHAMVGYTKGSPLFPFMQVTGRNFILFLMINAEARMQDKPLVFYLFFIWSLVECVRYPYYLAVLLKKEYRWLTWLRYTIWIPLYPLGTMVEGIIVLRNLPYFDETKRFTIEMPNKWNFTFDMVGFMKFYMTLVLLPGLVMVMRHLSKLRAKKLRTPKIYSVPKKAD